MRNFGLRTGRRGVVVSRVQSAIRNPESAIPLALTPALSRGTGRGRMGRARARCDRLGAIAERVEVRIRRGETRVQCRHETQTTRAVGGAIGLVSRADRIGGRVRSAPAGRSGESGEGVELYQPD